MAGRDDATFCSQEGPLPWCPALGKLLLQPQGCRGFREELSAASAPVCNSEGWGAGRALSWGRSVLPGCRALSPGSAPLLAQR